MCAEDLFHKKAKDLELHLMYGFIKWLVGWLLVQLSISSQPYALLDIPCLFLVFQVVESI